MCAKLRCASFHERYKGKYLILVFVFFYFIDNPFPQQGAVITIKLSEETETVQHHDGPQNVFIEMLFEMNYETGHWRRLKRTRVVSKQ